MSRPLILVVEDHPVSQILVRDILVHAGFDVVCAASVDEGRQRLVGPPPALILMDIELPGGGGPTLLREVRARPELRAVPVIALTANAMPGDRERMLAEGFDDYLSKPIDTRTFAQTVRAMLDASDAAAP